MIKKSILAITIFFSIFLTTSFYLNLATTPVQACYGECTGDCQGCNTGQDFPGEVCDDDCGYMDFCCSYPTPPGCTEGEVTYNQCTGCDTSEPVCTHADCSTYVCGGSQPDPGGCHSYCGGGGTNDCGEFLCPDGINTYHTYCDPSCDAVNQTCIDSPACPGPAGDCNDPTSPTYNCAGLEPHCGSSGCGTVFCAAGGDCQTNCVGCGGYDTPPGYTTPPPASPSPSPKSNKACKEVLWTDQFTKVVTGPLPHVFTTPTDWENALLAGRRVVITDNPYTAAASRTAGAYVIEYPTFPIHVDFSKLAAIFAPPSSNYLEGKYQQEKHRLENISALSNQNFNDYHGPVQKGAPIVIIDTQRVNYVKYVNNKPKFWEYDYQFSDISGTTPQTIAQLVTAYGIPNPPSLGGDAGAWQNTWAHYWDKIPTAINEFYYGYFTWNIAAGTKEIEALQTGKLDCVPSTLRRIFFVMPEYFRTTSIANFVNQFLVPVSVQSSQPNFVNTSLKIAAIDAKNTVAKIMETVMSTVKKFKKVSFEILTPIKNAHARFVYEKAPEKCPLPIPVQQADLESKGSFCSLPLYAPDLRNDPPTLDTSAPQIKNALNVYPPDYPLPGTPDYSGTLEHCTDVNSPYKLDDGTLVDCTFKAPYTRNLIVTPPGDLIGGGPLGSPAPNGVDDAIDRGWDSCVRVPPPVDAAPSGTCVPGDFYVQCGRGDNYGEDACDPASTGQCVGVPWQCNALGTGWDEVNPAGECTDACTTCYPPRYSCTVTVNIYPLYYIPWLAPIWNNTTYSNQEDASTIQAIFGTSLPKTGKIGQMTGRPGVYTFFKPIAVDPVVFPSVEAKKLPSEFQDSVEDIRQRYFGATDCNKQWSRDIALKPKALQSLLGINAACSSSTTTAPPPPVISPPPTGGDCGGIYNSSNSPQGNFGDPGCDFSFEALSLYIQANDPANLSNWLAIALLESGYNPNAYNGFAIDPAGAWGLFQMGRGRNGIYDHGDVEWHLQVTNAINYNALIGGSFCYWQAAIILGLCSIL